MCGAGHRDVEHPSMSGSPVDSLQDWLAPPRGRGVGGARPGYGATAGEQAEAKGTNGSATRGRDQVEMQRPGLRAHSFISP